MKQSSKITPTHKALTHYYATLEDLAHQNVSHEMGIRRAFQELLAETAKLHDWTLVTEESSTTAAGKSIRPDGTLRDKNTLPRGFWESKDTGDSLTREIAKKSAKGYSLANTIFEDSQTAILYQNKKLAFTADLTDPQALADLLNQFYAHTEPDFEHWEEAVEDFKDRVPDLARGLVTIIETAHKKNQKFKDAFADFFTLCQTALNPNIAQAAVDEMLIQHLLTERLFRTIFNVPDFINRNVIAAEVEKVIDALASQSFSRAEYLKSLDRFYLAIENAAKHLDWTDKQHFLNVIYERFFQGYSVKTADTMGIVYTPQPIVDFMCASVVEVLRTEFKKHLGGDDVFILDPCTGTGNFIVNLLRRIPPREFSRAYATNLFANEIMLLPYYIAALNIEHAHYELTGRYEAFEGLCFVDTLDIAEHSQRGFDFFTAKNTERVERQKKAPITVIIGNPPYNIGQENENDKNRNRSYDVIDERIANTYARDSRATLRRQLYDPYVKFFRWAVDRLGSRDGIICLVTNNSFVDQIAFDGMRRDLMREFSAIYHIDLHGNVRINPKLSGTTHNVFGIQVGVGITVAVKKSSRTKSRLFYHRVAENLRREEKCKILTVAGHVGNVNFQEITPDEKHNWIISDDAEEFESFLSIGNKESKAAGLKGTNAIFASYGRGVATNADGYVYDFDRKALVTRAEAMVENFNRELDRWNRSGKPKDLEQFLIVDEKILKWGRNTRRVLSRGQYAQFDPAKIRVGLYRPFVKRNYYFERTFNEDTYQMPHIFPTETQEQENFAIGVPGIGGRAHWSPIALRHIPCLSLTSLDTFQCFPFYIYDEDGSNRRENITDWALTQFRAHYHDDKISKWDIFHYVYALLHHPAYRTKFADNLKRELPRIPFAPSLSVKPGRKYGKVPSAIADGFWAFAGAGKKLADLHLNYEEAPEFPLIEKVTIGLPRSPRVQTKMKLTKDKSALIVNDSLTLGGIPPETFHYKLGNRSALEWIIDQYQVYTDPRTQITSDPNAWGEEHNNPEYIVQLVGRIITVSLETQKIVEALPARFAEEIEST